MCSGLLQVFVELGNLHRTVNYVLYWIHRVPCSISHNWLQELSIPVLLLACSQDWTCNLQKGSKRYVVHMTSGQYSQVVQLSGDISSRSSHQRNSTWSRTVFPPSLCSCGKIYKGETGRPLKVRLEEHWKAVVWGEIEKLGRVDHLWKEKGDHLPLWEEVEIIDRAEHWRIRCLKESAHMLGYNDLLSRPSIEMNTI